MIESPTEAQELINQRIALTMYPDLQYNFDSEKDRTKYLMSLDVQLADYGIDGMQLQAKAVAERYGIKLPLDNVLEIEFPPKAS